MGPAERGDAHYDAEQWDDAGVALEAAVRERPNDARSWYRLGNVRTHQHRDKDALECFRRALAIAPRDAQMLNNFGAACERLGRRTEALGAYREALSADPALFEPYLNLGRLCESEGDLPAATAYLRAGLERHPNHPMLAHLLAAATGEQSAQAPRDHMASFYDGFATEFDAHLKSMEYQIPEVLAALLRPRLGPGARIVDLGCGTGQVGAAIADPAVRLVGVDVSPGMLEIARKRGVYAELLVADAAEALRGMTRASCDLVIAADVFIYIGDLRPVFEGVAHALRQGGAFAFTVEAHEQGSFHLLSTGRYAHASGYLAQLAADTGFAQVSARQVPIRRQGSGFAGGLLVLFEKR